MIIEDRDIDYDFSNWPDPVETEDEEDWDLE